LADSMKILDQVEKGVNDLLPRVLILGGTGEGIELASRLYRSGLVWTMSSLAGRVNEAKRPEGFVRVGGFGGVNGLVAYLMKEAINVVVDVTHPFAAQIGRNAELACARLGLPLVVFTRPPWIRVKGDIWHEVANFQNATDFVNSRAKRVFLSIGRQEVGSFSGCENGWFLIRAIQEPIGQLPRHNKVLLRRGPFNLDEELQLLRDHSIEYLVSKNSGGLGTYAKIQAARLLGIPVVMINRPVKHTVQGVEKLEDAVSAVSRLIQKAETNQ
jgi:precorrin-6A/cobalt-precorrin-6A reductase